MIEIKQILDKTEWENFVLKQLNTLFVQSFNYGEFYKAMGESCWLFGVYDNEVLKAGSLVVSTHAKRGNFLYIPYGPIGDSELWPGLFENLRVFAKEKKFDFIRVSPFVDDNKENHKLFKKSGFMNAPMHVLAETTWLLDLEPSEEELISQMEKNHRNLIRRCIKENVLVNKKQDLDSTDTINTLLDETAKRHHFFRFSKNYITNEFNNFSSRNEAVVFDAYLPGGELDSSAVIMYYGNMAAYRHGASLNLNNKTPTSYLVQWEAIKEAKKRGIRWYNFWGIAPVKARSSHPFKGITHFKKGFGGFQKDLLHCQDMPISCKYWLNWAIETVRRFRRGFN